MSRYGSRTRLGRDLNTVLLQLVPRAVDDNPQLFEDNKRYWEYTTGQVKEFFGRLPDDYTAGIEEERMEDKKAAVFRCTESPYELRVGFFPQYHLILNSPDKKERELTEDDVISCPMLSLVFNHADQDASQKIVEAALSQFFLVQGDLDDGTLLAFLYDGVNVLKSDLEMLTSFLPAGTKIEARCNYQFGNGKATYCL